MIVHPKTRFGCRRSSRFWNRALQHVQRGRVALTSAQRLTAQEVARWAGARRSAPSRSVPEETTAALTDVARAEHGSNVNGSGHDMCLVQCAKPFDHEALMTMLSGTDAGRSTYVSGLRKCLANRSVVTAVYDTRPIGCILATPGPQTVLHNPVIRPAHCKRSQLRASSAPPSKCWNRMSGSSASGPRSILVSTGRATLRAPRLR